MLTLNLLKGHSRFAARHLCSPPFLTRAECPYSSRAHFTNSALPHFFQHSRHPLQQSHRRSQQARMGNRTSALGSFTRAPCQKAPGKAPAGQEVATFAGGCFWGVELAFQRVPGVTETSVGYTKGRDSAPTYEAVCSGNTGHTEAVQVYYDPKECSYESLLGAFFANVDPTTKNRQGMDMGTQYRSGIYYHNDAQKQAAEKAIAEVNAKLSDNVFRRVMGTKVVSELLPADDYYVAESYHQQYLEKGGRFGSPQNASKGATDKIRCYG